MADSAETKPTRRSYTSEALDAHPASEIAPMSVELADKVAASDFSAELIERVLAVRPDREMINFWLDTGYPGPDQIEAWVAGVEAMLESPMVVRTATWHDHDMLVDLCANAPETVGEWSVTVERGPNPYAQYRLQEHPNVNVLEDRRVALGMTAASGRNTYIDGQRTSVNLMSGWRIRDGFRGMGLSNHLRSGPGPGTSFFGLVTYYYVRLQNSSAAWIDHIEADMQDRPEGFVAETERLSASLTVFPASAAPPPAGLGTDLEIGIATEQDLPRCIELINRTHQGLDLFRPYTLDFIGYRLDDPHWGPKPPFNPPVYGWPDFRVVRRDGEIVACGGLWDRGRDVREVWRNDDAEIVVDPTALMDFGFAEGHDEAMVHLIHHFLGLSAHAGRSGMMAALDFLPSIRELTQDLSPRLDTRELHVMPFSSPEIDLGLTVTRPYTDIAYW